MRVSTSMIYDVGRQTMQRQTAESLHAQQQLASGRRIVRPSDDPVSSARALEVGQTKSVNGQFLENQGYAKDSLRMVEGSLSSVTDILVYVRTRAVEAGNGTYSQPELDSIANDLRSQYEQLRALANSRDGEGNYLFSGYSLDTAPFAGDLSAPATVYAGDDGQRRIQVSASRELPVSMPGSQVFGDGATGLFADLRTLIADLESGAIKNGRIDPGPPPVTLTGGEVIGRGIGGMDAALDRVLTQRAAAGSRLGELDTLAHVGSDYDLQYAETLSRLQDLDYNEAISRFSMQQSLLQAAQQTYVKVTSLSLFSFLR